LRSSDQPFSHKLILKFAKIKGFIFPPTRHLAALFNIFPWFKSNGNKKSCLRPKKTTLIFSKLTQWWGFV